MDVSILFPLLATTISMSSELLLECYVQNTDKKVITIFRLNQPFFDRYLTDTIKMGNLTLNFVNNNFSKLNETKMATITEKISKKSVTLELLSTVINCLPLQITHVHQTKGGNILLLYLPPPWIIKMKKATFALFKEPTLLFSEISRWNFYANHLVRDLNTATPIKSVHQNM